MIYQNEVNISTLKEEIFRDFDGILAISEDYNIAVTLDPVFYTWTENGELLGYIGIIYCSKFIYCMYTKKYTHRINKKMYNLLKDLTLSAETLNIPFLTSGTTMDRCKHHVEPYGDNLYKWVI